MKSIIAFTAFFLLATTSKSQEINPNYDSTLAKSLGADDYGMKMYVLVILKSGSNTTENKATTDSLFRGHMSNILRLVDLKKLIVAGPIAKNDKDYRGIFILDTSNLEEANKLLDTDPAISAKLLAVELYQWYGSAALAQYLKENEKIWKLKH